MQITMHYRLFELLSYLYLFLRILNYEGICEVKDSKDIVGGTDFSFTNTEISFKVQCVELSPASYQMFSHKPVIYCAMFLVVFS